MSEKSCNPTEACCCWARVLTPLDDDRARLVQPLFTPFGFPGATAVFITIAIASPPLQAATFVTRHAGPSIDRVLNRRALPPQGIPALAPALLLNLYFCTTLECHQKAVARARARLARARNLDCEPRWYKHSALIRTNKQPSTTNGADLMCVRDRISAAVTRSHDP